MNKTTKLPCGWLFKLQFCKNRKCADCPLNKKYIGEKK